ncbi:MAG: PEGA domain-containing protein [bacterium]|nr:PEGA domain-containing protein [bacterium]
MNYPIKCQSCDKELFGTVKFCPFCGQKQPKAPALTGTSSSEIAVSRSLPVTDDVTPTEIPKPTISKPVYTAAQLTIADNTQTEIPKPTISRPVKKSQETEKSTYKDPLTGIEFVFVKGGCYQMGDTFGDGESDGDEKPVHEVCVDDFYIGKYEVTQKEWVTIMGNNPSYFQNGDNYPVESVSWNDVQEFIIRLNQMKKGDKEKFRLPTEAEWEYAARSSGKKEKFAGTSNESELKDYAWYDKNSGEKTHPVGQKKPNGLGLYDMTGNVEEWVQDWYSKGYYKNSPKNNPRKSDSGQMRVFRGGLWGDEPWDLRASCRNMSVPADSYDGVGFRLVLSSVAETFVHVSVGETEKKEKDKAIPKGKKPEPPPTVNTPSRSVEGLDERAEELTKTSTGVASVISGGYFLYLLGSVHVSGWAIIAGIAFIISLFQIKDNNKKAGYFWTCASGLILLISSGKVFSSLISIPITWWISKPIFREHHQKTYLAGVIPISVFLASMLSYGIISGDIGDYFALRDTSFPKYITATASGSNSIRKGIVLKTRGDVQSGNYDWEIKKDDGIIKCEFSVPENFRKNGYLLKLSHAGYEEREGATYIDINMNERSLMTRYKAPGYTSNSNFPKDELNISNLLRAGKNTLEFRLNPDSKKVYSLQSIEIHVSPSSKASLSGIVTANQTNIRSGPSSTVIASASEGDKVSILSKEGDWYRIQTRDNRVGYIHNSLLSLDEEKPRPEASTPKPEVKEYSEKKEQMEVAKNPPKEEVSKPKLATLPEVKQKSLSSSQEDKGKARSKPLSPEREAIKPKLATITVASEPSSASVYLDGKIIGSTPLSKTVAPGRYTIVVRKEGFEDWSGEVTLSEDEKKSIKAELKPVIEYGKIQVTSSPPGASVYLDGEKKGSTPILLNEISSGAHNIKLVKGDFVWTKATLVIPNATTEMKVELRATIVVDSEPTGASIYLDNELIGTTPFSKSITAGKHTIILKKAGYKDWPYQVTLSPEEKKSIKATLRPD